MTARARAAGAEAASRPSQDLAGGGLAEVVRGSVWVTAGSLAVTLGGLVFWLASGRVAGAEAVGYATTAFSAAGVLSSLANLGLNYAALRWVPVRRARAYGAVLLLAVALGSAAALASPVFAGLYGGGFTRYVPLVLALTVAGLAANASLSTLIAAGRARAVFAVNTLGALVKVGVGVSLALAGLGGYGLALGILSSQLASAALSTALAAAAVGLALPALRDLVDAVRVGASNYPLVLSTQLLASAGVVLIAALTGDPGETGVFYIALMATLALSMIPASMALVSLPVMVRSRDYGVAGESLRLGAALVLPLAVAVGLAPHLTLSLVNPDFARGAGALGALTLSVVPLAYIQNAVSKLNGEGRLREVLAIGAVRLAALTGLTLALAPRLGAAGAALAFLASTLAPTPIAARALSPAWPLKLLAAQAGILAALHPLQGILGEAATAALGAAAATLALHATGALTLNEAVGVARTVLGELLHRSPRLEAGVRVQGNLHSSDAGEDLKE
ncbi:lipopolysaccharide biosynthesis protein [Stetteria hydrogenophila]